VHASRWAKDLFLDLFVQAPADVNAYLRDSTYAKTHLDVSSSKDLGSRLRDIRRIHAGLVGERPYEYSHCVSWAAARFEEYFANLPNQMLKNFPPEQTQKDGAKRVPFWTGTKRVPAPITFDANVPSHVTFIVAAANLRAAAYGLRGSLDPDDHAKLMKEKTKEKPDAAMDADTAAERAAAEAAQNARDEAQCATLLAELPARETLVGFRVREAPVSGAGSREPLVAAFVAAAASLRADVHGICKPLGDADGDGDVSGGRSSSCDENDWLGLTATGARPGAPAAAALAGALVAIETHKLAAVKAARLRDESEALFGIIEGGVDSKDSNDVKAFVQRPFRHTYASVGDWTACVSAAPSSVQTQTAKTISKGDLRWSVWDVIDMDCRDGLTLQGFIERFEREVGLQCGMVSHGASLLYADFMNRAKIKERLESPLASAMKLGDDATHATLSVGACDENDDDVDIPEVRVRFR
jgi:ubiquitin-activating enzyme E1